MIEQLLKKLEKGDKKRRCMTCKYWYPVTEDSGKCMNAKDPIYKLPNYLCDKWQHWREHNT